MSSTMKPFTGICSSCLRGTRHTRGSAGTRTLNTSATRQKPADLQQPSESTTSPELLASSAALQKEPQPTNTEAKVDIGSSRRRAALASSAQIPFEQLPYQCFQEALKVLRQDREQKVKQINAYRARIKREVEAIAALEAQSADKGTKPHALLPARARLRDMQKHLTWLKVQADINDPAVKRKFEDGQGDMSKPVYRHLQEQKWRSYERKIVEQRLTQMHIIPDVYPAFSPSAQLRIKWPGKNVLHGEVIASNISELPPSLQLQVFDAAERFVTVAIVNADVPSVDADNFRQRCHGLYVNIPVSPTSETISLRHLENAKSDKVLVPWLPPYCHKGAPWNRMSVWVLEQKNNAKIEPDKVLPFLQKSQFSFRAAVNALSVDPVGATLFRTKWDEHTADLMNRHGIKGADVEYKLKPIEPMPYKKRDGERFRLLLPEKYLSRGHRPTQSEVKLAFATLDCLQARLPLPFRLLDYIALLNESISRKSNNDKYSDPLYVNGVSLWRSMFGKAEQDIARLEAQKTELEQKLGLRGHDGAAQVEDVATSIMAGEGASRVENAVDVCLDERSGETGAASFALETRLARQLREIHDCVRTRPVDPMALAMRLVDCSSEWSTRILQMSNDLAVLHTTSLMAQQMHKNNQDSCVSPVPQIKAFLNLEVGSHRCILATLQACRTLSSSEQEPLAAPQGAIVYAFVQAFGRMLDALSLLCLSMLPEHCAAKNGDGICAAAVQLENLIAAVLNCLSPVVHIHRAIYEGAMFLLLQRCSKCLRVFSFGEEEALQPGFDATRTNDISPDVVDFRLQAQPTDIKRCAMRHEALFLGRILERASAMSASFLGNIEDAQTSAKRKASRMKTPEQIARVTKRSYQPQHKSTLSIFVRERLQQTLIEEMFPRTGEDESDALVDCLVMPPAVVPPQPTRSKSEKELMQQEPEKWFANKVWDLVGWDILLREDA